MSGTQSIERAIHLLKLFDDQTPTWSLQDLVVQTGLKKTTVFRILTALKNEGFLEQAENNSYHLGSELIVLGGRSIRRHRLRNVAHKEMTQLATETGESVTLDVLWVDEGGEPKSMVVDEVLGNHLLGLTQFIGVRFPANITSTGKVLLAYQPAEVRRQLNFDHLRGTTEASITSPKALFDELDMVFDRGYGTTIHELEIGLMGIATPVFDLHGQILASLSVAGPASRVTPEKLLTYLPLLKKASVQISHQMGHKSQRIEPNYP